MILLLAAAPAETTLLRAELEQTQAYAHFPHHLFSGSINGNEVLLAHGGIGSVNMAIQTTRLLSQIPIDQVLLFGCGGHYPQAALKTGDISLATSETYGDLGVETGSGFIPLEQLDIPQNPQLGPPVTQKIALDPELLSWAQSILSQAATGPFVTVTRCSGTTDLSDQLQERTGGICENMEGIAVAEVCQRFHIPLLELRGMSNPTGTRDSKLWNIRLAVENAQRAVQKLLANWPARFSSGCKL
jgi:futalosine hydrolase